MISICKTNIYNAYCHTVEAINRIEWRQRLRYDLLGFKGYKTVLKPLANNNKEYILIINLKVCIVCKVLTAELYKTPL